MPVSRKMAQWMAKQVKEVPKDNPPLKQIAKSEMAAIEMVNMPKKELEELAKGRGIKADAADVELARRAAKKEIKKGNTDIDPDQAAAPSTSDYKKYRASVYNKGGVVKKKPAAKKAPAKKVVAKKNTYNKFYGK